MLRDEGVRPTDIFRYGEKSQRVLQKASGYALFLHSGYLGTEHLLLALLPEPGVQLTLQEYGVHPDDVRELLHYITGDFHDSMNAAYGYPRPTTELTPRAKKILQLSHEGAVTRGSLSIEPIDIFAGVVREGEGIAAGVLSGMMIGRDDIGTLEERLKKTIELLTLQNYPQVPDRYYTQI